MALSLNDLSQLADALESEKLRAFIGRNAYRERDAIAAVLADALADRCFDDIAVAVDRCGLWYASVDDLDDLLENPQLQHNQTFREVSINGETMTLLNHPLSYDGLVPDFRGFALKPGSDTRAVLEESGFSPAEVNNLLADKVAFSSE